jgi:branched-chain amino acid transport system substrate-binding protein
VLNDKEQGEQFAKFSYYNLFMQSAATIDDGGTYSEELADIFASAFEGYGGSITAQSQINIGDTDMQPVLESIAPDEPEMLYYPVFSQEAAFITKQAAEVTGLKNTLLASADAAFTEDFIDACGSAAEGMYTTAPIPEKFSNEAYIVLRTKVIAKSGEEPQLLFHAFAYDATDMILNSIEDVAVQDSSGNLVIGRKALRDALYATSGYQGVTGRLTCDQYGDCGDPANVTIYRIENEEFVKVHEIPGILQMFLPMISNKSDN